MKFSQYITESKGDTALEDILTLIHKECQPFLKEFTKGLKGNKPTFLYSGRNDSRDYFTKKIRTDRSPSDTPIETQEELDDAFKKKFNITPRSGGLFVTGNKGQARGYGNYVYMIFPKGKFKFIWSPGITDLYIEIENATSGYIFPDNIEEMIDTKLQEIENDIRDDLENRWRDDYSENSENGHWEYTADDEDSPFEAPDTIGDEGESLYDLTSRLEDEYSEVNTNNFEWVPSMSMFDYVDFYMDSELDFERDRDRVIREVEEENEYYISNIVDSYTDKKLLSAITSHNEIMIVGKDYIAVREDLYADAMFDYYKKYGSLKPSTARIEEWYESLGKRLPKQLTIFKYTGRK